MVPMIFLAAVVFRVVSAADLEGSSSCASAICRGEELAESVGTLWGDTLLQVSGSASRTRIANDLGNEDDEEIRSGFNFDSNHSSFIPFEFPRVLNWENYTYMQHIQLTTIGGLIVIVCGIGVTSCFWIFVCVCCCIETYEATKKDPGAAGATGANGATRAAGAAADDGAAGDTGVSNGAANADDGVQRIPTKERREGTLEFESDAYSHALLTCFNPNWSAKQWRYLHIISSVCFMTFIWLLQFAVAAAVHLHLMGKRYTFWETIMSTWGASQFGDSIVPTRISPDASEIICGKYSKVGREGKYGYVTAAGAAWIEPPSSWDTVDSLLHANLQKLFILSMDNGFNISGLVFHIAIWAWTAESLHEIRSACFLSTSLFALKDSKGEKNWHWDIDEDGGAVILDTLTRRQKALVALIAALRVSIALYLYAVGCAFLCENLNVSDLVLNAVALTFIIELDALLYKGASVLRTDVFEEVARVKYRRVETIGNGRYHIGGLGAIAMAGLLIFLGCLNASRAYDQYRRQFDAIAFTCLFLGPPPNTTEALQGANYDHLAFPVPGLCESLTLVDFVAHHPNYPNFSSGSFFQDDLCDPTFRILNIEGVATHHVHPNKHFQGLGAMEVDDLRRYCCAMLQPSYNITNQMERCQDPLDCYNKTPGQEDPLKCEHRLECYNKTKQAGYRIADEDKPDPEDVAAFWCPSSKPVHFFPEGEGRGDPPEWTVDKHALVAGFRHWGNLTHAKDWDKWIIQKPPLHCNSSFELSPLNASWNRSRDKATFSPYPKCADISQTGWWGIVKNVFSKDCAWKFIMMYYD